MEVYQSDLRTAAESLVYLDLVAAGIHDASREAIAATLPALKATYDRLEEIALAHGLITWGSRPAPLEPTIVDLVPPDEVDDEPFHPSEADVEWLDFDQAGDPAGWPSWTDERWEPSEPEIHEEFLMASYGFPVG